MASLFDPAERCPDCGLAFLDFRRQGRLGCPRDYDVFREQLRVIIERHQRAARHAGKHPSPEGLGDAHDRRRLRRELAAAVANDDFQRAAELRDRLREGERIHGP